MRASMDDRPPNPLATQLEGAGQLMSLSAFFKSGNVEIKIATIVSQRHAKRIYDAVAKVRSQDCADYVEESSRFGIGRSSTGRSYCR